MEKISVESEVISCENVKPSSPTPLHQQNYQLSMLDQISPPSLVPLVLYFPYDTTNSSCTDTTTDHRGLFSEKEKQLKASLSLTLTRFYPLAGRVSGNGQFIHCNDEGVPFSVVSIKVHKLSELLKTHPDPELWDRLFPCRLRTQGYWGPGDNVAMIQVNHFDCGGVAIAAVFWHKVVDAVTVANFFKYWAATAQATEPGPGPSYIGPSFFPPRGEEELQTLPGSSSDFLKNGKFVKRRYVFDVQDIQRLKAKASKVVSSPTRVEVVMALLWKTYMVASLANDKPVSAAVYSVNLRRRTQPPLPSEGFGNLIDLTAAICTNRNSSSTGNNANELGDDGILGHLVKEVRNATSEIDNDYVKRMCGDQGFLGLCENRKHTVSKSPGADTLFIVVWCGMGFYDVDFGWGKPVWLSISDGAETSSTFYNTVSLLENKLGGVEAWMTLEETYMKVFDNCEELKNLAFP